MTDAIVYLKTLSPLRITVSGEIGSGKSTFAKRLAEELGIPRTYAGGLFREEAARRGITTDELSELTKTDDTVDRALDETQRIKAREQERGIFEGRTAWYFVEKPNVKIFFTVDPLVAAQRIFTDTNTNRDTYHSAEEIVAANKERRDSENMRYRAYYDIDAYDPSHFDLLVDTSSLNAEEVYQMTVKKMANFLENRP